MRKPLLFLTAGMILFGSALSYATPFDITQTYSSGRNNRHSYITMNDRMSSGYSAFGSQTVAIPLDSALVTSAFLDITFSNISTNARQTNELWSILVATSQDGNPPALNDFVSLGQLLWQSRPNSLTTLTFNLSAVIPDDAVSSWTLYMVFREETRGNDTLRLYNTRLYGDYGKLPVPPDLPPGPPDPEPGPVSPVPEPGTLFLLGFGLIGVAAIRMTRNK
jgi:hypothetical protein